MPSTRIDTRRGWIGERRSALLLAVQRALVEGLRIPQGDRDIVLCENEADAFLVPDDAGVGFCVIQITLITGRSIEAKRRLYASLVAELGPFGLAAADIRIILIESDAANWGVRGRPASEIDLGFDLNI